jgi:predicted Zn-dependent protease with MMP-like domain
MQEKDFENLVNIAVAELPPSLFERMENVAITIEKRPAPEQLRKSGIRAGGLLLGLYQGVPKTKWGRGFGNILPDKITIFQEPIERLARNEKNKILEILKNTIFHEIAHHFGFTEKEIRELERKRKLR